MNAAALIRDRLGAVPSVARKPAVHAVVAGFADQLPELQAAAGLEDEAAFLAELHRALLWGHRAWKATSDVPGYRELACAVAGTLHGLIVGVPVGS